MFIASVCPSVCLKPKFGRLKPKFDDDAEGGSASRIMWGVREADPDLKFGPTFYVFYTRGQRNVLCNKMWWVQCPIHCQFHSQNQLFQDDICGLSISNSTKIFKGAEYNLSIHAYKFCSARSLRCRPAWGRRRTPFKLGLVQRSTTSERRSWETSKLSYRRPILGVQKKI